MAPSSWTVICCPVAGKKKGKETVENEFLPAFRETLGENVPVEVVLTESKGHATELAKKYGSADNGLIAVGGDGTIHEVMDGLIEKGVLAETPLGLLSQGTMNFYAISGGLASASELPKLIAAGSTRQSSLMRVKDAKGMVDTMCFEALYFGVGYKPAKGAQEWRNSCMGPMFGIMKNLVVANMFPKSTAVSGKLRLWPSDGGDVVEMNDTFFWIVVTQRSPYNGALCEDMWVSLLPLADFPGFGRMMNFFGPPMELFSGMAHAFQSHHRVKKFEWTQDEKCGPIGVCLDGDPTDASNSITVEHVKGAWKIVAEETYPERVPGHMTKVGATTTCAKKWLEANPPPEGVYMPKAGTKPTKK